MGNRAVIATETQTGYDVMPDIYLHWNGGWDSVSLFMQKLVDVMGDRITDVPYSWARLIGIIHNHIEPPLSLGVALPENTDRDNGDNGTYFVTFLMDGSISVRNDYDGVDRSFKRAKHEAS